MIRLAPTCTVTEADVTLAGAKAKEDIAAEFIRDPILALHSLGVAESNFAIIAAKMEHVSTEKFGPPPEPEPDPPAPPPPAPPKFWCLKVDNYGLCFELLDLCTAAHEKFAPTAKYSTDCEPQDVAACFNARDVLSGRDYSKCSPSISMCKSLRAEVMKNKDDYKVLSDCAANR